jgi:hypothetical protein
LPFPHPILFLPRLLKKSPETKHGDHDLKESRKENWTNEIFLKRNNRCSRKCGLSGGSGFLGFGSHQVECAASFEPFNLAFIERVSQWDGLRKKKTIISMNKNGKE